MFRDLPSGTKRALGPYYRDAIGAGRVSGELYEGPWENVGTPAQLKALDEGLRSRSDLPR
jgi:N-acetyl-alpha-D-muramate 1-phosphate uridylyltransferase